MEDCFFKGFLVVLLIRHSMSEGPSTSIQSSTAVSLQDDQSLPKEPELPPADVVPVVAPPSLREVQQAVQEASEQVEGRGAEEVLKGLLERVVEAALGHVEGAAEAAEMQETVEEDVLEDKTGGMESETEAKVSEQVLQEEEVEGGDVGAEGGDTAAEEEQEVVKVNAFVAEEGEGGVQAGEETAVEETAAGVETGGEEAMEVTDETAEGVEETTAPSEEAGGHLAAEENEEQVELAGETGAAETETQELEETPAAVEVEEGGELEQVVDSLVPSLVEANVEQIDDALGNGGEALGQETQEDEIEGEVLIPPTNDYELETTQAVVGKTVMVVEEEEEEVNIVKDAEGEVGGEQGHLALEGGAAEEVEAGVGEAESEIKEESVALVNDGGDGGAAEEDQIAVEPSHTSEKEEQEVLLISAPDTEDGADATVEQSPENQVPTPNTSLGGVEAGKNTLGNEEPNQGNEIITPTDDLLPHDPVEVEPTLDNSVKDVLAEAPENEAEEPGEANELVEDKAGATETSELGLEAWKIGAISAAVFLVLETVVMIIYILKCRNKNSSPALQRACEEGCVEPEAATGGDCSDDTLPAGNGDTQQIAVLDPSDVASTLAQTKEQHQEEHVIAMSDLPPSSTEESADAGPGPDSLQDLRTSIL